MSSGRVLGSSIDKDICYCPKCIIHSNERYLMKCNCNDCVSHCAKLKMRFDSIEFTHAMDIQYANLQRELKEKRDQQIYDIIHKKYIHKDKQTKMLDEQAKLLEGKKKQYNQSIVESPVYSVSIQKDSPMTQQEIARKKREEYFSKISKP
jgi:hypothetical protein